MEGEMGNDDMRGKDIDFNHKWKSHREAKLQLLLHTRRQGLVMPLNKQSTPRQALVNQSSGTNSQHKLQAIPHSHKQVQQTK
jgi:hypothetical protein